MNENIKRPLIGVGIIVTRQNKVLIGMRKSSSHGASTWQFPGGHLEWGESPELCAIRETLEETGLRVEKPRRVSFTNDVHPTEDKHYVTLFMQAECPKGEPVAMEPEKSSEWHWVEWEDLPRPLFLPVEHLLEQGYHPFA